MYPEPRALYTYLFDLLGFSLGCVMSSSEFGSFMGLKMEAAEVAKNRIMDATGWTSGTRNAIAGCPVRNNSVARMNVRNLFMIVYSW
jgi:hypothetical protein